MGLNKTFSLNRTYERETISKEHIGNATEVSHHIAIFIHHGEGEGGADVLYVASCFTFESPTKVPVGVKFNVRPSTSIYHFALDAQEIVIAHSACGYCGR